MRPMRKTGKKGKEIKNKNRRNAEMKFVGGYSEELTISRDISGYFNPRIGIAGVHPGKPVSHDGQNIKSFSSVASVSSVKFVMLKLKTKS